MIIKINPPVASVLLTKARARMVCSPLQGRLVLGPDVCDQLDAMAADTATPWATRQAIANAVEWRRTSQTMDELGWVLGFTDVQMDDLFTVALGVTV